MNTYSQQGYEWIHTSSSFQQQHPTKLYIYNHTVVIRGEREKGRATSKSEKQAGDIIWVRLP